MKTQELHPGQYPVDEAGRRAKARANRAMFDGIATRYDVLNRLMSLGLDGHWRRRLADLCILTPGARCLDLCCGTGDVARELLRRGARVAALDASAGMLTAAQRKAENIMLVRGDALALPFATDAFDAVTIAFGNRNVASLETLYAEMRRVVKPGGRVVSLEISRPAHPALDSLFFLYFSRLPALFARLLGADPAAYHYLPESVRRYPSSDRVADIMRAAGLREVHYERHLGGVVVLHRGVK